MSEQIVKNVDNQWTGKRFVCLVRQSSDSEGTTSTQAQLALLKKEGAKRGMVYVDAIVLEGVTGSLPGKRNDMDELLERKRRDNDFEVLLIQVMDRMTRGGTKHAFWFEYECDKVGIEILFIGEDVPTGSYSNMIKAAKYDAAREQARSIGMRSTQGWLLAIEQGRNCVISRTPFACDRLYYSSQGKPLFLIRNLGDGRQQKLHWETHDVIDVYGQIGGGTKGHYRKQKDEKVQLVPGEKEKVQVVCRIFDLHYNGGWGGKRIADDINRRGVLSPTLKGWSQRQIESIYENPVYTGWAVGSRISQGIYCRRGEGKAEPIKIDPKVLANCHSAPRQLRPPEDWIWQEQPEMKAFLPNTLAEKALAEIKLLLVERWERSQDPNRPKRSPSKHKASEYILTDLLFATQDGQPLTGVLCGRKNKKVRYYRHRRGSLGYLKGSVYNKMIHAESLESAVIDVAMEMITDEPNIRQRILDVIAVEAPSSTMVADLENLKKAREQITVRTQLIARTFDEASLADVRPELKRLSQQRLELDQQITTCENRINASEIDPNEIADGVIAELQRIRKNFSTVSAFVLRQYLRQIIDRIDVDMETKNAEVWLKLPKWALSNDKAMRLAHSSPSLIARETHPQSVIHLAYFHCHYHYTQGAQTVCYRCRRIKSVA